MNIVFLKLYITNELNNKFYNSQELGLAKALIASHPEHRVDIILLSKDVKEVNRLEVSDRLSIIVVPAKGVGHHGMLDLSILKELSTELVHLLADNMLYAPNVISYCKSHNIKCHLYIGTLFTDSRSWSKRAVSKLLMIRNLRSYRKVPVYAKTPKVLEECKSYHIDAKLSPVGMSVEDTIVSDRNRDDIRLQYDLPLDKRILLFVGRFESYKHPTDAVKLLGQMDESYHLLFVGRGPLQDDINKEIADYGIEDRVTILSKIPNKEMKDIFKASDFYINFNPDEIYGMAILEAMCHMCPVFAITAPGPDFLLENSKDGFICADLNDMAIRIEGLSKDLDMYKAVQKNAREKVLSSFVWDKTVQCFEDF